MGDLLLGHPYCNTMHITLSSGDIQYFPPRLKLCARKRWSHKENIILWNTFKYNITKKVTPTSLKINKAAELLFNSMWAFEYVGIFSNAHKIIYIYIYLSTKCCGHFLKCPHNFIYIYLYLQNVVGI